MPPQRQIVNTYVTLSWHSRQVRNLASAPRCSWHGTPFRFAAENSNCSGCSCIVRMLQSISPGVRGSREGQCMHPGIYTESPIASAVPSLLGYGRRGLLSVEADCVVVQP